jgi:hypothetical protein
VTELPRLENALFISLATDGEDGPADAAGAVVSVKHSSGWKNWVWRWQIIFPGTIRIHSLSSWETYSRSGQQEQI